MKRDRMLEFAIIGGILITLLTGLLPNMSLIGASWRGYPLGWLIRLVLAPQYFPWKANYVNLVIDIVFWSIILGIILAIVKKVHSTEKGSKGKKQRK